MYQNYTTEQLTISIEAAEKPVKQQAKKLVFKPYSNRQNMMILSLEEMIPEHHIARLVDEMVESVPDPILYAYYTGGGCAPYHPKMLLKVILYAYTQKVYSSRGIEKMLHENMPMMWLAACQKPDHRTINEFRGVRMPNIMDDVFEQFILQLIDEGVIDLQHIFVDGTKIEANANKYSFVWGKAISNYAEKLQEKIKTLVEEVRALTGQEMKELPQNEQLQRTAATLAQQVADLEQSLEAAQHVEERKEIRKERTDKKKKLKLIKEDFGPRLIRYAQQREILGERNSYSKTDPDATFMRMKDDHMKNGQLKAAYNVQLATQNQFIIGYELFQRPGDTRCFEPFMEKLFNRLLPSPEVVVADAGYASEQNYLYALGEEKEPRFEFVSPYNTYLKEKKRSFKKDIKQVKNWAYDETSDTFTCPNNRKVAFKRYSKRTAKDGFVQDYKIYECEDCSDCPLKAQCTKAQGNRQVHLNMVYEEMKAKARAALEDEKLSKLYAQRKTDVESVFGHLKGNLAFTRFLLRGLLKTRTEFGLIALAHNLRKLAGIRQANSAQTDKNGFGKLLVFRIRFILGTY